MTAEPGAVALRCGLPYSLRDAAGREGLLADWTQTMAALAGPVQIWHGPHHVDVDAITARDSAANRLARTLAASARARQTLMLQPTDVDLGVPWSAAVAERADHVVLVDNRVGRVFALRRWPATVVPDWLAAVTSAGVAVSLHLRPVPRADAARLLRRRVTSLHATDLLDQRTGRTEDTDARIAAETAEALRDAVARGSSQLLHAQLLLAVVADTTDLLDSRCDEMRESLAAALAEAQLLRFEQGPAWAAAAPGGAPLARPWRLLDASSVAASIPHPVGPEATSDGVLVGVEPWSGVPLLQDRFGAHNPTRLVVGTSGAGKSYAAKLEVLRQRARDVHVTVVDPEGEFSGLGDAAGLTLTVGEEPTGLDPVGLACSPQLAPAEGVAVLASWAAALCGSALSPVDLALIDRALAVLRADRGRMASPTDLLSVIAELAAYPPFSGADLAARLAPAAGGLLADLFAPNPDLQMSLPLVVFDLRAVPDRVRAAVMSCVLAWAWCQATATSTPVQRLVVVDEAHLLLDDDAAATLLATFARRARKYQVALDVVTQRLSDFLGHPAGEAVLANAASKLLLACEDHERAAVASGLGLTGAEADWLRTGSVGQGLLLTPTLRTPIEIVAADVEHVVASSGPRRR